MERISLICGDRLKRAALSDDICLSQLNHAKAHRVELDLIDSTNSIRNGEDVNGFILLTEIGGANDSELGRQIYGYAKTQTEASFLIVLPCWSGDLDEYETLVSAAKNLENALKTDADRWLARHENETSTLRCVASAAIKERLSLLDRWMNKSPSVHVLPCLYDPEGSIADKEQCVKQIFDIVLPFCGNEQIYFCREDYDASSVGSDDANLPKKPPGLHWTNWPRPEEVQLTFRVTFHVVEPGENEFRSLLSRFREHEPQSEYVFEWVDGILLRFDPVKVFLGRQGSMYELSGRIDLDELEEETDRPMNQVWTHLASYLELVLDLFDDLHSLPYQIHLIPIGPDFYEQNGPAAREHAFDLTQLMTAIELEKSNRCCYRERRSDGVSSEGTLKIDQCFPSFQPRSLGHLRSWLRKTDRDTAKNSVCCHSDLNANMPANCNDLADQLNASNLNPSLLSPNIGRRGSRDGRRVSFGTISVEGIKLKTLEDPAPPVERFAEGLVEDTINDLLTPE